MIMKNYKVIVNGTAYEVSVEEINEADIKNTAAQAAPSAQTAAPAPAQPAAEVQPTPAQTSPTSGSGEKIESPMPGTILSVNVSNGTAVKEGDILFVLEAMKMENEILAPISGTVSSVNVTQGATVNSGSLLCTIG